MNELVLSLFPGVGLLDRAFTAAGFCVVQGPDLITGGDIRNFRGIMRSVDGVIAGPPCQGFSVANSHRTNPNHPSVINSREMLQETCRVIKTPKSVTTKTDQWTDFADLCRSQGLDEPLKLDGWYRTAKFKAVGNGVPLRMGRILAEAVANRSEPDPQHDCQCGCGRTVSKRAKTATPACRKRKQMSSVPYPWIDEEGYHETL